MPVPILTMSVNEPQCGLGGLLRALAAEQRVRGFTGLSPAELHEYDKDRHKEDEERQLELD